MHKFKLIKAFHTKDMDYTALEDIAIRCIITPLDCSISTTVIVRYTVGEDTILDKWLLKYGASITETVYIEHTNI